MPAETKIDPTLLEQLTRAGGDRVPALIELADQPRAGAALDRNEAVGELESATQDAQAGLMQQLHSLGLEDADITTFTLVNAVAVSLTRDQVMALSERADVAYIRYGGEANVAL